MSIWDEKGMLCSWDRLEDVRVSVLNLFSQKQILIKFAEKYILFCKLRENK